MKLLLIVLFSYVSFFKATSSENINDLPSMNISLISAFDNNDTYILDEQLDENINGNVSKLLMKRLNSALKRNGQTLKKLKPFNKETFQKISAGSTASDDDVLNINFPTNLINSN